MVQVKIRNTEANNQVSWLKTCSMEKYFPKYFHFATKCNSHFVIIIFDINWAIHHDYSDINFGFAFPIIKVNKGYFSQHTNDVFVPIPIKIMFSSWHAMVGFRYTKQFVYCFSVRCNKCGMNRNTSTEFKNMKVWLMQYKTICINITSKSSANWIIQAGSFVLTTLLDTVGTLRNIVLHFILGNPVISQHSFTTFLINYISLT